MFGLEASWASRAFNGLEFCSFGRFYLPSVFSGVVIWSYLFERPLWPTKEGLPGQRVPAGGLIQTELTFSIFHFGQYRVMVAVLSLGRRLNRLLHLFLYGFHFGGFALFVSQTPLLPVPHAMNVIPTLTKNVMGHDMLS